MPAGARCPRGRPAIRIGIGIASGPVIAGFTGTTQRVTCTCVGDAVNVAAHLEARTKVVGRPILIDETTRAGLDPRVPVEEQKPALFRSRSQPVAMSAVPPGQAS